MAITAPKFGTYTLPHVSEFRERESFRGGAMVLANGGVYFDTVTTKKKVFILTWRGLTTAQKEDISARYMAISNVTGIKFTPPTDGSATEYDVTWSNEAFELEWTPTAVHGGRTLLWETTMTLREK